MRKERDKILRAPEDASGYGASSGPVEAQGPRYELTQGVRVFRGGGGEIRFRRGVWNFSEAVLNMSGQPAEIAAFFTHVSDALVLNGGVDLGTVARETGTPPEKLDAYAAVLDDLVQQQFLTPPGTNEGAEIVRALFGGTASSYAEATGTARPVAFFADTPYAAEAARSIGEEAGLPMDVIGPEVLEDLASVDLTTRNEAIGHSKDLMRLRKQFDGYFAVMGCVAEPNMTMLRNLNRVLVASEKPLILGLVDGPFVTVLSTFARETGCVECYEHRIMARLEDTVAYRDFVRATAAAKSAGTGGGALAPSMHLLTSAVLAEGILFSNIGMLRLAGRALSVYLPLLEIQAQDILRVPYCPACGHVSTARMDEIYRSSNRLVADMLSTLTITQDAAK